MDDRRGTPRIQFPTDLSPRFTTSDGTVKVVNCSESGLQIQRRPSTPPPTEGSSIVGSIRFFDGTERRLSGVIVRTDPERVSIKLDPPGIPQTMLEESFAGLTRIA